MSSIQASQTTQTHPSGSSSDPRLYSNPHDLPIAEPSKVPPKHRAARQPGNARKPCKQLPGTEMKVTKVQSTKRWPHDPADLEDDDPTEICEWGRAPDEFLDRLTIPCHSKIDKSHRRVRCIGAGCWWSWAQPRATARIFKHARRCSGINPGLKEEVQRRGDSLSLASMIKQLHSSDVPPSLKASQRNEARVNYALLKLLCDRMKPPVVDTPTEASGEPAPLGRRDCFEVEREDGVFLESKLLSDILSDDPHASTRPVESPSRPEYPHKREPVDIDSIVF